MTGKQASFAVIGAQNEAVAEDLIGRLSAPVRVPREHDFGVDFFCQLYSPEEAQSVATTDVFTLQVKGSTEPLHFGGIRGGEWRAYELAWLRTVAVPHFLARVDATQPTLDLYCLGPIWRVLWQTAMPFEISCATDPPTSDIYQRIGARYDKSEESHGDCRRWSVPLGPPFLRLTHADLADRAWRSRARSLLELLIRIERANLLRFHQRVALHKGVEKWSTNGFSNQVVLSKAMYWSKAPGGNLQELAEALAPVVVNLGAHLQWQNDSDAYRLIEVLEWLDGRGKLDPMGRGLLEGLKETRGKGIGPAELLGSSE